MEIHYFESVSSTNTALLEMSKKSAKSWTAVWTANQSQGKGYAGSSWISEKGKNIAVSLLIKSVLNYSELVFFNQWVCNSICTFLEANSINAHVKWPNDIIIKDKKVCGVLIETYKSDNQINIIVGIGLNVNQTDFENLPKAGSLATQAGRNFDIQEILSGLLTTLEANYNKIEKREWQNIIDDYNARLFKKGEVGVFKQNTVLFNGIVESVDKEGLLHLKLENGSVKKFKNKEIEMMY